MSTIIVIPARYASSRYPGKPLAPLIGATGISKPLIQRSWEAAKQVSGVDAIYIATDDERIAQTAKDFGADVLMTAESCQNGTERCADALAHFEQDPSIIVNLQGDAPLTPPWIVEALIAAMKADSSTPVATPGLPCEGAARDALLEDRRAGRVGGTTLVRRKDGRALYFSKEVLPFSAESYAPSERTPVLHHVGVYAYTPSALRLYMTWAPGPLEQLEGLEQLRFLENGTEIAVVDTEARGRTFWELNNPSDVERVQAALHRDGVE